MPGLERHRAIEERTLPTSLPAMLDHARPDLVGTWGVPGPFRRCRIVRSAKGCHPVVGRPKDMVHRSRESIAAAEVEQVPIDLPGVTRAAVVPVPEGERGEEVQACTCLTEGGTRRSTDDILAHRRARLAGFTVPRYTAVVNDLPTTPSDKVAKRLLVAATDDPRAGSSDAVEGLGR